MKEYFKLTGKKILGIIILLFLFSFISFFLQYISNPTTYVLGQYTISIGLPLDYASLGGKGIENFKIFNLIIDIIIFYFIVCLFSIAFKGGKKQNVPNSNSGGGSPSPTNQTQS
jgi:hypothetical protein